MINALNLWIKHIILVVVFASFVEILTPEGKLSKYIKVLLGVIVMIAIINPLIRFLSKGDISKITPTFFNYDNYDTNFDIQYQYIEEENQKLITNTFQEKTKDIIKNQLDAITVNSEILSLEINFYDDKTMPVGKIKGINIMLKEPGETYKDQIQEEMHLLKEYLRIQFDIPENDISINLGK